MQGEFVVSGIKRGEEFGGDNGSRGIVKLQGFSRVVHGVVESSGKCISESLVIAGDNWWCRTGVGLACMAWHDMA